MSPEQYSKHLRKEASDAAQRTLDALIKDGRLSEDEAIDSIVMFLDAILPLQALVPGPVGVMLEAGDEFVIRKAVEALAQVIASEQAKQRRKTQRQARQRRREMVRQNILNRMRPRREEGDG